MKQIEKPYDKITNFLIENALNDANALNLLEKIILSKLYVFGEDFQLNQCFETLENYLSNVKGAQEALEKIKTGIKQIGNYIVGQSETIQDYQQRLTKICEKCQDPRMWHFLVQLNKRIKWPSVSNLQDILKIF